MSERAKRAAAVLRSYGWQMDEADGATSVECLPCGQNIMRWYRYCPQCGARVPQTVSADSLEVLEAAIAAALGE